MRRRERAPVRGGGDARAPAGRGSTRDDDNAGREEHPRVHELAERAGREARGGGRIEGRPRGERPLDRGEHALAAAHRLRGEDVR